MIFIASWVEENISNDSIKILKKVTKLISSKNTWMFLFCGSYYSFFKLFTICHSLNVKYYPNCTLHRLRCLSAWSPDVRFLEQSRCKEMLPQAPDIMTRATPTTLLSTTCCTKSPQNPCQIFCHSKKSS